MPQPVFVRKVKPDDAIAIAGIYKPYVENTAVSFEYIAPDASEMERRIGRITLEYPFFVAVCGGRVIGYAYASSFKDRAAYCRCAELSVYVDAAFQGRGVGTLLYAVLENALRKQGVRNAYACIAYPDRFEDETLSAASVRFHSALGYRICGCFHKCGYKFGRYYSMVWMGKSLA